MLASTITLAIVLVAVLVFHGWSAHEWGQERHELVQEITNIAVSRTPYDLQRVRQEMPSYPQMSELPDGFDGMVGL